MNGIDLEENQNVIVEKKWFLNGILFDDFFFRGRYCLKLLLRPRSFSFRFVVIYYYYS